MIENIKNTVRSELFIGSLILMILVNIGNIINYIFHFSMVKLLGPVDYGIFAVLTNIIYIFSVPALSIQTLVSKHTTKYNINKEYGKIKGILISLVREALIISLIIYFIFLGTAFLIYEKLGIPFLLLALTGIFLFEAFIYPIITGILQGMKKFNVWGGNYLILCLFKFLIAITLVILGFKLYGAVLGFLLGTLISFFLVFFFIKEITNSRVIKENINIFSKQSSLIFFIILIVVLMYSIDVILAKIFFEAEIAGKYAIASLIGKIILFGTSVIGSAMFPISSEKYEIGEKTRGVIKKTFFAVLLICFSALLILGIFPELLINILFGKGYLSITGILIYVGIGFSFLSFLNIFILYKISIGKIRFKHIIILAMFLIFQILIMSYFNSNLESFSIAFMVSTIIIFIASIVFIRR
ncbi:MAG: oligosaccharide flippase family protein [Nanoarchaeota archaeon]